MLAHRDGQLDQHLDGAAGRGKGFAAEQRGDARRVEDDLPFEPTGDRRPIGEQGIAGQRQVSTAGRELRRGQHRVDVGQVRQRRAVVERRGEGVREVGALKHEIGKNKFEIRISKSETKG